MDVSNSSHGTIDTNKEPLFLRLYGYIDRFIV